jgi:hypothetical protein
MGGIRRILCFLGIHSMGPMYGRIINQGFYDQEEWAERKCSRCGYIREYSLDGGNGYATEKNCEASE